MGTGTFFLASWIIDERWNMLVAMAAGMVLGLLAMAGAVFLFIRISTAFHLLTVGMPVTMVTGMASGMYAASGGPADRVSVAAVIAFAFLVQFTIDLYNANLSGEVPVER